MYLDTIMRIIRERLDVGGSKMRNKMIGKVFAIVTEICIYLILAILTYLLAYNKLNVKPFQRGLFCDDQSISYPYTDDTVSDIVVVAAFVLLPMLVIGFVEFIHFLVKRRTKSKGLYCDCQKYISQLYRTIGAFLFGATVAILMTEAMKIFSGRLRPHFLDVCKLNTTKVDCSGGYIMVTEDDCTETDEKKLIDARKSFPSGHASMCVYGAVYMIIYLYCRFIWTRHVRVFVPTLCTLISCAAAFVSISRVSDNKHHATDVLFGALIGAVTAIVIVKYVSCLKAPRRPRHFTTEENDTGPYYNTHEDHYSHTDDTQMKSSDSTDHNTVIDIKTSSY